MNGITRSLRLFFERELDRAGEIVSAFRRLRLRLGLRRRDQPGIGPPRRERPRRAPGRRAGSVVSAVSVPSACKKRARGPRKTGVRYREGLRATLSTLASIVFHSAILGILYVAGRGEENEESPEVERLITVTLLPSVRPAKRAEQPSHVPEEASVPVAPEQGDTLESESSPPPGEASSPEPPEGEEVEVSDRIRRALLPELPLPIGVGGRTVEGKFPGIQGAVGLGHRGTRKEEALRRHGGSEATESAVAAGLRWLAAHQDPDGGWSAEGFQRHCRGHVPCSGRGLPEFDVGVTALATLAFLGAGYTPRGAEPAPPVTASQLPVDGSSAMYSKTVSKALEYLMARQSPDGIYGKVGNHYLYNHSLATMAMAEALAATGSEAYRSSLENAVSATALAQQASGAWDYTSAITGRNDLSVTGWQIMALRAAIAAGVEVPASTLEKVRRYLLEAVTPSGEGIYTNKGLEAGRRGVNMVAVGLLSNLYMGVSPSAGTVRAAVRRVLRCPPAPSSMQDWETSFQSYYYWYTATLALFHLGGQEWRAWNLFLLREILPLQSRRSHEEGSWPPEWNWVGVSGGRVYATAINVLTLEAYYRYDPLHGTK